MNKRGLAIAATIAVLILLPAILPTALLNGATKALIAALFALAFNLLMGQGGMLSFGHGAYLGIGAFATIHAMVWVERGGYLPLPLMPLVGGLAGLAVGLVAGFFATKRAGTYFAMVTLAIAELLHSVALKWTDVFGGEAGLSSMRMHWAGFQFGTSQEVYFLVLPWVVLSAALLHFYTTTPFGRVTLAIRDNEMRARFVGIDSHRAKTLMFAISAMFAGIAGSLLAITDESVSYAIFDARVSALIVLQSFIGGVGVFLGPAVGAAALTIFAQVVSDFSRSWLLYQGLLFIVVMMFIPHGIYGSMMSRLHGHHPTMGAEGSKRMSVVAIAVVLAASALIFLVEVAATMLSPSYVAASKASPSHLPMVNVLGSSWDPASTMTWGAPLALIFLAFFVLIRSRNSAGTEAKIF